MLQFNLLLAQYVWKVCVVMLACGISSSMNSEEFWTQLRECSGYFEDVSSNTVICFWVIPQEFRRKMKVLLDTTDKEPLHSHCCQVNACQKNNFVNKRRLAFLYWKKKCYPPFSNKIVYVLKGGRHFCTRKKCYHFLLLKSLQSFTW